MIKFYVSELLTYLKDIIGKDYILNNLEVEGEISNLKFHGSGSIYMDVKDDYSVLNCYCPFSVAKDYRDLIKDGDNVILSGKISINEKNSNISFIVSEIKEAGTGQIFERFEQLKKKLSEEGLFDEKYKKQIPSYPKNIGIITSETGAAIRDILTIADRRNPYISIYLYPANVQGSRAESDLINGLEYFSELDYIDLVIIGRGGGSYEDLDAFNSEKLARKIFDFKKPIISAVGHEIDFVITDFVADKRAATPSEAAEIVFPNMEVIKLDLLENKSKMENLVLLRLNENLKNLEYINKRIDSLSPNKYILRSKQEIDNKVNLLSMKINNFYNMEAEKLINYKYQLEPEKHILNKYNMSQAELISIKNMLTLIAKDTISSSFQALSEVKNKIDSLDTTKNLNSGYSLLIDHDNNVIKNINDIKINEEYELLLSDGTLIVKVVDRR